MINTNFKLLVLITIAIGASMSIFGQNALRFERYKVNKIYQGKTARPIVAGEHRMFRTRLTQAAREKPNFAGEYIVATWGCGTSCLMGAVINARTGRIYSLPHTICCWTIDEEDPIDYRLNSRLISFSGMRNESRSDAEGDKHYYEFRNGRFVFIRTVRR